MATKLTDDEKMIKKFIRDPAFFRRDLRDQLLKDYLLMKKAINTCSNGQTLVVLLKEFHQMADVLLEELDVQEEETYTGPRVTDENAATVGSSSGGRVAWQGDSPDELAKAGRKLLESPSVELSDRPT